MDWFHFAVLCFVCIAASTSHAAINSDYDDVASCLPKLADTCFSKLYKSIACHFDPRTPRNCTKDTAEEICSISSEALRCASDIINGDCNPSDGRDIFDNWMNGLTAVLDTFCEDNAMGVRSVLQTNKCWNLAEFVSCVNTSVGIGHVVDLMNKKLDLNICYKLAMGMTSCNARVARSTSCRNSFDVVDKSLHAMFTTTQCGVSCPTEKVGSNGFRQKYFQEAPQKETSGKSLNSGAISTSVTVLVSFTWMCLTL